LAKCWTARVDTSTTAALVVSMKKVTLMIRRLQMEV
jgi:hypothetical protein